MSRMFHTDPRRDTIDLSAYAPNVETPGIFHGLPRRIAFRARCGMSNQRPNSTVEHTHTSDSRNETIAFDDEGVCDACCVAERKQGAIDR